MAMDWRWRGLLTIPSNPAPLTTTFLRLNNGTLAFNTEKSTTYFALNMIINFERALFARKV
jgi:hypothetical protein